MQKRNKYIVTLAISVIACILWLLGLKETANYAIFHPLITNYVMTFVLAVGGGICVSLVPGIVWDLLKTEDEITGESE